MLSVGDEVTCTYLQQIPDGLHQLQLKSVNGL
jgi:hypothetical protein